MYHISRSDRIGRSSIQAMHSLSVRQADRIISGLSGTLNGWTIERQHSCDGQLSVLLTSIIEPDILLIVDRDAAGMQISRMHGDALTPGECRYCHADDIVDTLKSMTASEPGQMNVAAHRGVRAMSGSRH